MPTEGALGLEYHERWMASMLFSGTKPWITFLPYHEGVGLKNVDVLLKERQEMLEIDNDEAPTRKWMGVIKAVRGGVTFRQKHDKTAYIPPFWPHMVLSVETSTAATRFIAKAQFFLVHLHNTELWHLTNSPRKKPELVEARADPVRQRDA